MIEVGMTDASEDGTVKDGRIEEGMVGDGVVVEATIDERLSGGTLYPSFGSSHCFGLRTVDLSPNASRVLFGAMVMLGTLYPSFGSSHCFGLRTVDLSPNASRVLFGAMVMLEEQNPKTPARISPVRPRPDMTLFPDQ
jgi:hypothetical protein